MLGVLGLGFLIGMQHALEVDHIAAVSSIAARRTTIGGILKHGLTWGIGHSLTLFIFAGAAILLGRAIPEQVARPLEAAAGLMLISLGSHLLWRLLRERASVLSEQRDRAGHLRAQCYVHSAISWTSLHHHERGLPWRSLAVGLVHGMAGSAALFVLAASQLSNSVEALLYVVLFSAGSIAGMGALSMMIAIPLSASAQRLAPVHRCLQGLIGTIGIGIGGMSVYGTLLG
jgi:high-affinity nickel permease